MKLDFPRYTERFGAINLSSVQRVYELDSGKSEEYHKTHQTVRKICDEELAETLGKLAIIIPIKSEKLKLLEGVLSGIPHDCLVIIVSNSPRHPVDRFKIECDALKQFIRFVDRDAIIVHQKDLGLAEAFQELDYKTILDGKGVRDGKAEGMVIGMLLAKMMGKEYVGFIDADNYIPGAVNEYAKIFASGILMSHSPYSMVRISWIYKPKVSNAGIYFAKWGRISEFTNKYLNAIISHHTGFETDIINTGNSGEHAMSIKLAELLTYSSGFSVEPYEIVNMIEEFGGLFPSKYPEIIYEGIDIQQIETRNPHFHEDKGEHHLKEMLRESLSCILSSKLCTEAVRRQIIKDLEVIGVKSSKKQASKAPLIQPFRIVDIVEFARIVKARCSTLGCYGSSLNRQLEMLAETT
jgi:mannosyl-3-phosphoglycerate synthase